MVARYQLWQSAISTVETASAPRELEPLDWSVMTDRRSDDRSHRHVSPNQRTLVSVQTLFSTDDVLTQDKYRKWLDFSDERFMPMVYSRTDHDVFDASAQGMEIGDLAITRASFNALMLETTPATIRHPLNKPDVLGFSIKLAGECFVSQYDRTVRQGDGDISIIDANAPFKFVHLQQSCILIIQIPRHRLEDILGPARNFSAISMKSSLTVPLLKSFLNDFLCVYDQMSPDTAARMASVGTDLIVASVAECLAQETPANLRGTINVQRAKAYIEANLHNPALDSSGVAAAVRLSLRQLQMLFDQHGHRIAEWIWLRRLKVAAERLVDPACQHLSIGALAFGCGFLNLAHFSRRFKGQFNMSPSDYRRRASSIALRNDDISV